MASNSNNKSVAHAVNGNGATTNTTETHFANDIASVIMAANSTENVIISPLQLEALLTLLYLGSDGNTAEELQRVMHLQHFANNAKMAHHFATELQLSTDSTAETHMQLCSELILPECYEIADEFYKIAQKYFHTQTGKSDVMCSTVKFRAQLNDDLTKAAFGYAWRISDALLASMTAPEANSALILAAVHFQNKWFLPFSQYRTGIYDFQLSVDETSATEKERLKAPAAVPVPMLFDDDMFVKFAEFRELDARAIELPYEHDEELSMLVVLPNRRDGLVALEKQLQSVDLKVLAERMQMENVQVLLPKFKIDFECCLRRILEQLGIQTIFSKAPNFKNMLREKHAVPLRIADILHKVCIEVNESGTEGAKSVVYKPIVISNSMDSRKKFFRADHPFYFAIRCREVTYFVGHITKF
ncbi:serine protease inhibitor 42Dd [Eurosta solidaginis]|uniref:serine protease inhibitor 42Dd n=1 Tax=Eurosta solidaginis TaxID=178769 RepID=UPI00353056D8